MEHVVGEHSTDSSVIFSEKDRILFIGNCLFVDIYNVAWSYSTTKSLFPLIDKLLSYNTDYYVDRLIPKAEMIKITDRLKEIGNLVDSIRSDKEKILKELSKPVTEDDDFNLDCFLAGLRKEL